MGNISSFERAIVSQYGNSLPYKKPFPVTTDRGYTFYAEVKSEKDVLHIYIPCIFFAVGETFFGFDHLILKKGKKLIQQPGVINSVCGIDGETAVKLNIKKGFRTPRIPLS